MKDIVTAWQMKDPRDAQRPRGRGLRRRRPRPPRRAACRRGGLADAARRRAAAPRPLSVPVSQPPPRQRPPGNGKYIASPRVDSYHGVWFELHEDLILLAGRTRADEVAAGRA